MFFSDLQMMRTDAVTPSHENESRHDGYDIDALYDTQHKLAAKEAIAQQHHTGDEPDQPGYNANSPRAPFNKQVMYLRVVGGNDECCSHPPDNFHVH